jgi:hypothetical protein
LFNGAPWLPNQPAPEELHPQDLTGYDDAFKMTGHLQQIFDQRHDMAFWWIDAMPRHWALRLPLPAAVLGMHLPSARRKGIESNKRSTD